MNPTPLQVLVAGGGVAGLEALLALRELAGDRVELTLLTPGLEWVERPMAVAEPFSMGRAQHVPLARVAHDVGALLVPAALAAVDAGRGRASTDAGEELAYDALLVAPGVEPVSAVAGARTWTPESAPDMLGGLLRDLEEGYAKRIAFVVPEGVTWALPAYELALMTAREVSGMGQDDVDVLIVTPEPAPLALFGPAASDSVARELALAGVRIECGTSARVERAGGQHLVLEPGGRSVPVDQVVALPRYRGPGIRGLACDAQGFVRTDRLMRVPGARATWAAGDGADYPIKQGGLAAQQAEVAAAGIAALAGAHVHPRPFRPVLRGILLTGDGRRWMHRRAGGEGAASSHALWWPPAKIAAPRLAAYLDPDAVAGADHGPPGHRVLRDLARELPPEEVGADVVPAAERE